MNGAVVANRIYRKAYSRAELHHGLVEIAGIFGIEQSFGRAPALCAVGCKHTPQDTLDVAIHYCGAFAEGDAGDGSGSVASDAGKRAEFPRSARKSVGACNQFCSGVQVASAAVISEAAPGGEHACQRRARQNANVRKALEKIEVAFADHRHTRLLQHDFGDPDLVSIALTAPGQPALMATVPSEQRAAKCGRVDVNFGFQGARRL